MQDATPTILEIGPGRGDFLLFLAKERPCEKIAAIEYKRKRFDKLLKRCSPYPNISLHLGNAEDLLPELFPPETLREVYILFPDPWPKRRHAKHRLFRPPFLEHLEFVLKAQGQVIVATDDNSYRRQIEEVFGSAPFSLLSTPFHFPTFYAQKWVKEGRTLFSLVYEKRR